jgi:hypothetical protein
VATNTIVECRVRTEGFAPAATLEALDVNSEAERVSAHDTDRVLPLL